MDAIEERLLSAAIKANRSELGHLRRMLLRVQRLLAPEPAALFRLLNRPPNWLNREPLSELRIFTEEFSVALNDLASLMERIRLLQEEIAARLMEQSNRTLFLLTSITVLALPINIVAGFFGMNVGGIPLANNPHGFLLLVLVVLVFTLVAGWLALRRPHD
ncbi:Mg2+ and Co2+ transporter CorA [Pantoea dispersa]|nr:Mg2+ and Co2+ transporter CorA [Pantoea dispersa]